MDAQFRASIVLGSRFFFARTGAQVIWSEVSSRIDCLYRITKQQHWEAQGSPPKDSVLGTPWDQIVAPWGPRVPRGGQGLKTLIFLRFVTGLNQKPGFSLGFLKVGLTKGIPFSGKRC